MTHQPRYHGADDEIWKSARQPLPARQRSTTVDDLSFTVPPGQVTGFLGPNGAGKSTTMRMILGLDAPASGAVTMNGRPYRTYRRPLFEVGALLEARAFQGGRSAYHHLLSLAHSNGIDRKRVAVVAAALLAIFLPHALSAHERAAIDSVRVSLGGLHLSQVMVGLIGVLFITGEYSSGMVRSSLAAVPQRRLMLAAKTTVFAVSSAIAGIAACSAAYWIFQAFLPAGDAMRTSLTDPGVARAVFGGGLYLAVLGLFGLGLGAVIRSAAGAVAALLGALFVPTILISLLPTPWQNTVGPYLPMNAGEVIYSVQHQAHTLAPWTGLGVLGGYAAAALVAGFIVISRRDA